VLGGAIPNLLVNGTAASPPNAVTNIPPHNLREVVSAAILLIDHPGATPGDLRALIPGPDFPTGALILGQGGLKEYQETGHGRLTMRARTIIENDELVNRPRIVITEVPYGIAPFSLTNEIANEVRDRRIDSISDLRFERTRDEVRISITLKRDASPERLLQQLYERTAMQTTLDVQMTALVPQPEIGALVSSAVTLKELLEHFIAHRHAVIARRLQADGTSADLGSREKRMRLIKDDLTRIAEIYGDDRRTEILTGEG
jgi:DNA gyrase subunit A